MLKVVIFFGACALGQFRRANHVHGAGKRLSNAVIKRLQHRFGAHGIVPDRHNMPDCWGWFPKRDRALEIAPPRYLLLRG